MNLRPSGSERARFTRDSYVVDTQIAGTRERAGRERAGDERDAGLVVVAGGLERDAEQVWHTA